MKEIREAFLQFYSNDGGTVELEEVKGYLFSDKMYDKLCEEYFEAGYKAAQSALQGQLSEALEELLRIKELADQWHYDESYDNAGEIVFNIINEGEEVLSNYTRTEKDCPVCGGSGKAEYRNTAVASCDCPSCRYLRENSTPCPNCQDGKVIKWKGVENASHE